MKYNIEGFDQAEMVRLGMDGMDAILLRWVVDFWPMTTKKRFGDEEYGWIAFAHVAEEIPCLGVKNVEVIGRWFRDLVKKGVLVSHVERSENSRTYFSFGPKYAGLVRRPATEKSGAGDRTVVRPATERSDDSSITDPSSNDPKEGAPNQKETVSTRPVSDLFALLFAERCEGAKSSFSARFVGPTQNLIRTHGLEAVLINVHGYFEVDWWFTKERSNGGHMWSYSGWLNHFDEIQSGISMSIKRSESSKKNAEIAGRLIGRTG